MVCCLIAAFLYAQAMAVLRRWGVYWGVVRSEIGETGYATFAGSVRRMFARPAVRAGVALLMIVELGGVGAWLYADHRDHIAGIVGTAFAAETELAPAQIGICGATDRALAVPLPEPKP